MTQYLREAEGVAPSNFTADFNLVAAEPGPFWMSFDYWVHTPDPAAGAFFIQAEWEDPTGQTIPKVGSTISLADGTSHNQELNVFAVQRLSGTSLWQAVATLIGPAGTSLISYRLVVQKEQIPPIPW